MRQILTLVFVFFGFSSVVTAQGRRPLPPPGDHLEQRVRYLEDIIRQHEYRLSQIESGGYQPPPPYKGHSCMIIDSGYSKVFFGQGRSQLQAETEARQECGKAVHPTYCGGAIKCTDGQSEPRARGYFCVVKDSGYGKVFSGEGDDIVEAEYKAKFACQSAVHPSYCGRVAANCEPLK